MTVDQRKSNRGDEKTRGGKPKQEGSLAEGIGL